MNAWEDARRGAGDGGSGWALAMHDVVQAGCLGGDGLPTALAPWRDEAHWRIVDTHPDWVLRLLATWCAWRSDPRGPMALRYDVALSDQPQATWSLDDAELPAQVVAWAQDLKRLWPRVQQGECLPLAGGALRLQLHGRVTLDVRLRLMQAADMVLPLSAKP